jgi:hypothetical protein
VPGVKASRTESREDEHADQLRQAVGKPHREGPRSELTDLYPVNSRICDAADVTNSLEKRAPAGPHPLAKWEDASLAGFAFPSNVPGTGGFRWVFTKTKSADGSDMTAKKYTYLDGKLVPSD